MCKFKEFLFKWKREDEGLLERPYNLLLKKLSSEFTALRQNGFPKGEDEE